MPKHAPGPGCGVACYPSAERRGFLAAMAELRATATHWAALDLAPAVVADLRELADTLEVGWYCHDTRHTAVECRQRWADAYQADVQAFYHPPQRARPQGGPDAD